MIFSIGYSVFTTAPYEKGEFIVEYASGCITFKEGVAREKQSNFLFFFFFEANIGKCYC